MTPSSKYLMRHYCLAMGLLAIVCPAWADDLDINDPVPIGLPGTADGVLRGRTQLMFDPATRALVRRWIQIWDAQPGRNRAFTWTPEQIPSSGAPAQGKGRLTWRETGTPSYDPASILSVYKGSLRNGRPEGDGSEIDRDGMSYTGHWQGGRPEGYGRLRLNDGAEYEGAFHSGMAEGQGRFVDIDGETYGGLFKKGLREGIATTVLPNGARYQSRWYDGLENAASRRVRLAQSSGGNAALDRDIRIGLSVVKKPVQEFPLHYTSTSAGDLLKIFPNNERLMSLWKGSGELQVDRAVELDPNRSETTVQGVFDLMRGDIAPLQIVLEAQNRSGSPIQVAGAFLKVEASSTDFQPAVQLSGVGSECGIGELFSTSLKLQNFGWGPVEKPVLQFAYKSATGSRPLTPQHRKALETFQAVRIIELQQDLKSEGVGIETLKRYAVTKDKNLPCRSTDQDQCLSDLKNSGLFGRLAGSVYREGDQVHLALKGNLNYEWRDNLGSYHGRESPFTGVLSLGKLPTSAECGEGAQDLPVAVNPVEFQLDQSDYKMPLVFERSLAPGRTARYSFALTAAKASQHRFRVVLQLADGREITSRPVDLTYFVPNWRPQN